ncbi:protein of unknown function [Burkholderia multivorans]
MRASGLPDARFPDFRKAGFLCLSYCGKYNKNNGLAAFLCLASTLQYKRHGHPARQLQQPCINRSTCQSANSFAWGRTER